MNYSGIPQGPGFASDTYVAGSALAIPATPQPGSGYRVKFQVSKTAAGNQPITITVRVGAAGAVADTARLTLAFGAATNAADAGVIEVDLFFQSWERPR